MTSILGAAKLTGRTAGGWSVGVLNAVTQAEHTRFPDADGTTRSALAEPLTNYLVARAERDTRNGQTSTGFILTAVERGLADVLAEGTLRSSAYAGGVDFSHDPAQEP